MNFRHRRYQNLYINASAKFNKKPLAPKGTFWYPMCRFVFGDIAQLVERLNGIEKVRGSTPLISTILKGHLMWSFLLSTPCF